MKTLLNKTKKIALTVLALRVLMPNLLTCTKYVEPEQNIQIQADTSKYNHFISDDVPIYDLVQRDIVELDSVNSQITYGPF